MTYVIPYDFASSTCWSPDLPLNIWPWADIDQSLCYPKESEYYLTTSHHGIIQVADRQPDELGQIINDEFNYKFANNLHFLFGNCDYITTLVSCKFSKSHQPITFDFLGFRVVMLDSVWVKVPVRGQTMIQQDSRYCFKLSKWLNRYSGRLFNVCLFLSYWLLKLSINWFQSQHKMFSLKNL